MFYITKKSRLPANLILAGMVAAFLLVQLPFLFAHGPKGHTDAFTALAAAKKATEMYDKLVAAGKLDASWETGLEAITVYRRETGKAEIVVKFSRSVGEPRSVYIFFTDNGNYSGSNFTGK